MVARLWVPVDLLHGKHCNRGLTAVSPDLPACTPGDSAAQQAGAAAWRPPALRSAPRTATMTAVAASVRRWHQEVTVAPQRPGSTLT